MNTYEYKFVRLEQDKSWFTGLLFRQIPRANRTRTLCTSTRARDGGWSRYSRQDYPCTERQHTLN